MHIRPVSAALFLVAAMSSSAADSAPTQPQVVGGATAASVSVEGKTTQVTQIAPRAVINWRTFNLADGETVAFAQPGASAILLNRVTGAKSTIDGTITANGRIFIVNTRGIVFGRNAQVNTGSLVAMTADIDPAKFLEGDPAFRIASPASSSILNQGKLTAETGGNVMLLAPGVVNQGTITAKDGHVVLATGRAFLVDLFGDGLVQVATAAVSGPPSAMVTQIGDINVGNGTLLVRRSFGAETMVGTVNTIPAGDLATQAIALPGGAVAFVGSSAQPTVAQDAAWIRPANDGGGGGIIDASPTYGLGPVVNSTAGAGTNAIAPLDGQLARLAEFNRLSAVPAPQPAATVLAGDVALAGNELYSVGLPSAAVVAQSVGFTENSPAPASAPVDSRKRPCSIAELLSKGCR